MSGDSLSKSSVRSLALRVLTRCERGLQQVRRAKANPALAGTAAVPSAARQLDRLAVEHGLSNRDVGLLTELVMGTVRQRMVLDAIVRAHLHSARKGRLEVGVRAALWLGAYQLVFLDRVPAHAAVGETVAALGNRGRRGLVNAVLRAVTAARETTHPGPERPAGVASERLIPLSGGRWLELQRDVLPPFKRQLRKALAACHSHPEDLVGGWLKRLGPEATEILLRTNNEPAPLFLRVNPLRGSRDELIVLLREAGMEVREAPRPEALVVSGMGRPEALTAFADGRFSIQDLTAMAVVSDVAPQAGERILDLCAAPGGKSMHLAEVTADAAEIVAVDVQPWRLRRLVESSRRLGLRSLKAVLAKPVDAGPEAPVLVGRGLADDDDAGDADGGLDHAFGEPVDVASLGGGFHRVLVDVPCSNTGVLRRRVEARWRQPDGQGLERLASLQQKLLEVAIHQARPDGLVVYSTCSIEERENQQVVRRVVDSQPGVRLLDQRLVLPDREGGDGGFVAKLVKASS